jgi:cAMP-dependent protein kinase regulator
MTAEKEPPKAPSSFTDRLAQWNERDERTNASALDVVRLGRSSDFLRLGATKRYSMNRHSSGQRSSVSKTNSGSISEGGIPKPPEMSPTNTPILMKKNDSPVVLKKTSKISSSSKASSSDCISELHPLQVARTRLRKKQGNVSTRKVRTNTVRAIHLDELDADFTPPVIEKSPEAEKVLRAALANNFVFEKLVPAAMDQLIRAFEPTSPYNNGDVIIQQGDQGDFFYVVESGDVSFEVNGHVVGSAKDGASFGELALLYTCPRAATVKATTTTTTLWRLEQTIFRYVLQSKARESKAGKYNLLKNINFFQQMEESDVQRCVNVMTPRKYEPGEFIVRKGEDGDAFYVVESGELTVTDITVGETTYEDVTLGPGDFFGERALVKNEARAANVVGVTAGTLFSIDRDTFERVCGSFVRLILKSQDKSRLSGLKVVKAAKLDTESVTELTQYLGDEMYRKGKEIFREGKKTKPALYMVREGSIQVQYSNGEEKIIKEGGYFGEDHLLADAKGTVLEDGMILAKYSATALEHNSICAILTLRDCRKVFDTKNIQLSEGLDDEDYTGMAVEEDEEFRNFVGRRASQRLSVNMDALRHSLVRESVLGEGQFGEGKTSYLFLGFTNGIAVPNILFDCLFPIVIVWEVSTDMTEFSDTSNFALKIQAKDDTSRVSYSAIQAIKRECQILGSLDHPFIVDLVHYYEDEVRDSRFWRS